MVNNIDIVEHLPFLTKVCLDLEAKTILELGVRDGNSTRAFLDAAKILNAKVISVDIEDCSKLFNDGNWEFYQMNDLDYVLSEEIDVLFIDTSHTFGQTLAELEKFAPMVKNYGVIILHDTVSCPDVYAAVKLFLMCHDEYVLEHRINCNGLGILWKRQ